MSMQALIRSLLALLLLIPALAFAQAEEDAEEQPVANAGPVQLDACEEDEEPEALPEDEPETEIVGDADLEEVETGDGSEQADDSELDLFRQTHERYELRVAEFGEEVNRIVLRQYDTEVSELREGYERLVNKADLEERILRKKAIEAHEKFVNEHEESAYTARRMFRLGELYFEDADEQFLVDNEEYDELADLFDAGKLEYLPEPPRKDYRKSIALYKRIIRDFPEYGDLGAVYYMLGYTYSDEASRNEDPEKARETYQALVDNVPDSTYRAQAFFRLADIYFEENQLDQALYHYEKILGEFEARRDREAEEKWDDTDQRLFELALYKVAWAYYKVDDLDVAVDRFTDLIEWAEKREARTGREADLKPEAVRYLAISLADLSQEQSEFELFEEASKTPMEYSMAKLDGLGSERRWTFEVLKQVAGVLVEQARFEDAIDAYQRLQARYPLAAEGPEFQNTVVVLYQNLPLPDPDGAADARIVLTNRYGLDGKWYEANKNNKDAIASATQYILQSLQWVAYSYHDKANKSGLPEDYLAAARKYEEYLERYPFAGNAYELNFYLAETYFGAEQWANSIEQYERLFGYPEDEYRKEAIAGIAYASNYLWKERDGDVTTRPEALAVIKPPLGEKIQYRRLDLSEISTTYVAAVRRLQEADPQHPDMSVFLYDIGQIYYYSNQLPESRRIYEEIIAAYPESEFAQSAAGQIVDSYLYTGQLTRMRQSASRFAGMQLGSDADLATAQFDAFTDLEKKGLFKEGELAYNEERYKCAVEAFEAYYDLYADESSRAEPKNIDLVLYNVAQAYSKLGNTDQSNSYYEKLLREFPESEQAPATFWKMASNYERVLELEKAVKYYEEVATYHPDHEDTPNAIFNAAFLKIGLGRFREAAVSYEEYHGAYPDLPDAKDVLYRSAELYESANDRSAAIRIYQEWLEEYGEEDADLWMETQGKLADYSEEAGKNRDADRRRAAITENYALLKDQLQGVGIQIAAGLHIEPIIAEYDEYKELVFTGVIAKDKDILTRKAEWNVSLAKAFDDMVLEYPDFQYQSMALYYKGLTFKAHAESWLQAPIPPEVEENVDLFEVYVEQLQKQAEPLENKAIESFKAVVDFAKSKKRHNPWVDEALKELNLIDENTYPVFKPEESTVIESDTQEVPAPITEADPTAWMLHDPNLYAALEVSR
ncbi:MAG: tetratricopeptide repeat protein [Deltaproteobacteria bacterium]|nr:tetratricopeptide repeat protein [Deltaproteobacteria bacterium]